MKRIAGYLLLAVGVLAGFARWVDLVNFTDQTTEFATEGSIWLRYGVVAVLLAAAALAAVMGCPRPARCERRDPVLGILSFAVSAVFAAFGGLSLIAGTAGAAAEMLIAALSLLTAWWAASLGLSWLGKGYQRPSGGIAGGVAGTVVFYVVTMQRFVQNYSSYYRVGPTLRVFSALMALLFASALLRAVQCPASGVGRKLLFTGLGAFYLCTCMELPQALCSWMAGGTTVAQLAQSAALAVFGLLGAACAMACLGEPAQPEPEPETPKNPPKDLR